MDQLKYQKDLIKWNNFELQQFYTPLKIAWVGMSQASIYSIPCVCGKGYIGQMGHTILEQCPEHMLFI